MGDWIKSLCFIFGTYFSILLPISSNITFFQGPVLNSCAIYHTLGSVPSIYSFSYGFSGMFLHFSTSEGLTSLPSFLADCSRSFIQFSVPPFLYNPETIPKSKSLAQSLMLGWSNFNL